MPKKYHTVGMGGTFDHFHIGHHHFLKFAANLANNIMVGVTTPELTINKTLSGQIEEYDVRFAAVEDFLQRKNIKGTAFSLSDQYGPTLEQNDIEAIVVTQHSVAGAEAINAERHKLGLSILPIHICDLLHDTQGEVISSTRVRLGQINREGERYDTLLSNYRVLNPIQISAFRKPQANLLSAEDEEQLTEGSNHPTVVVGDIVTETFLKKNWQFSVGIFDRKTTRRPYDSAVIQTAMTSSTNLTKLINPAGQITEAAVSWLVEQLVKTVQPDADEQFFLEVDGEEDLLTVAAVLLAPLGTHVYYGQPNQGIVKLVVNEALKLRFLLKLSGDRAARYRSLQPR